MEQDIHKETLADQASNNPFFCSDLKPAVQDFESKPLKVKALRWTGENDDDIMAFLEGRDAVIVIGELFVIDPVTRKQHPITLGDYIVKSLNQQGLMTFNVLSPGFLKAFYNEAPAKEFVDVVVQETKESWPELIQRIQSKAP